MDRRADPERIYQARRAALRNRLTDEDLMPLELAEQWIRGWEVEAADRGHERYSAAFWDAAIEWTREQRAARRSPV